MMAETLYLQFLAELGEAFTEFNHLAQDYRHLKDVLEKESVWGT